MKVERSSKHSEGPTLFQRNMRVSQILFKDHGEQSAHAITSNTKEAKNYKNALPHPRFDLEDNLLHKRGLPLPAMIPLKAYSLFITCSF